MNTTECQMCGDVRLPYYLVLFKHEGKEYSNNMPEPWTPLEVRN